MNDPIIERSIKTGTQVAIATICLFLALEMIFRTFGVPGASRAVEFTVIQNGLTLHKPKDEYRVFTYGESSMHGCQYAPVSNPARWLAAYLKDYLPNKKIKVVNFARMAIGSDTIYHTFKDTVAYKPDVAVFYMGHNDFLSQNRKSQVRKKEGRLSYVLRRLAQKSYLVSTLSHWWRSRALKQGPEDADDSIEFETIETPPLQIKPENIVPRTDPSYHENVEFFKDNLLKILRLGEKKKIPLLFLRPASNLKDFPPHISVHLRTLSPEEKAQWEESYKKGLASQAQGNDSGALTAYLNAYQIDSTYADLSFRLGQLYFKQGDMDEARRLFEEARDNDAAVNRATTDILNVFQDLEQNNGLQLLDVEKVVIPEIPGGILGEPIIEDNVHFSPRGHALIGRATARAMSDRNWIAPKAQWQFSRERSYEAIARELGIDSALYLSAYLKLVTYFGNHFDERVKYALKALEIDPVDPQALRHLAWTYWLMGEKAKALKVYERLQAADPAALKEVFRVRPEIEQYWSQAHSN